MHRIVLLIVLYITVITSLTSCYDANEVESIAFVVTIGIDKGVADKWRITVQFNKMKADSGTNGQSGGGGKKDEAEEDQDGYASVTMDCPSFYSGVNMLGTVIPRRLNFMHTKYVIVSEEIARSGELGEILTPLIRFRQIRRTIRLIIAKGSAMDLIKVNKPYVGSLLSKSEELLLYEQAFTHFTPNVSLYKFYNAMKSTYVQPFTVLGSVNDFTNFKKDGPEEIKTSKSGGDYYAGGLPRKGGEKVEFFGTAIFDGDRMVGELSGDETRQTMIARGELKRSFFGLEDPKVPGLVIPFDIRQSRKPDVKIKLQDDKPVIDMKIYIEGEILAIQSNLNYEKGELKKELEKAVEKRAIENQIKLISKCKALNADIFGFGNIASMQFGTIQEWEKYNWLKKFPNAQINVDVKFNIVRTGTLLKSSPIVSSTGEER